MLSTKEDLSYVFPKIYSCAGVGELGRAEVLFNLSKRWESLCVFVFHSRNTRKIRSRFLPRHLHIIISCLQLCWKIFSTKDIILTNVEEWQSDIKKRSVREKWSTVKSKTEPWRKTLSIYLKDEQWLSTTTPLEGLDKLSKTVTERKTSSKRGKFRNRRFMPDSKRIIKNTRFQSQKEKEKKITSRAILLQQFNRSEIWLEELRILNIQYFFFFFFRKLCR